MRIASIQVGRPRDLAGSGERPFRTAFGKERALFPVRATRDGLEGDAVADRRYHGGPDQAALAYPLDHYANWRAEGWTALAPGSFGENLSVEAVSESSVCIGDVWRCAGGAVFQVTCPRVPCVKIARFHGRPELLERVVATGRTGWYLRVLEEGEAGEGSVDLLDRPHPGWTVVRAALVSKENGTPEVAELARLVALGERWRAQLSRRVRP